MSAERIVAFLDANIFPHSWATDVLMTFADRRMFDPVFSEAVLAEARRAMVGRWGWTGRGRTATSTRYALRRPTTWCQK